MSNYIPIYKVPQLSVEDSTAQDLHRKHPRVRISDDGKHAVFCEAMREPIPPYVADSETPINEQQHILDWISEVDNEHPLYVTKSELSILDANDLLGARVQSDV